MPHETPPSAWIDLFWLVLATLTIVGVTLFMSALGAMIWLDLLGVR